ncbi:kinase-like domain-containing protein [Aspergillus karnatakaensis]|uniref:kinase-like domain-containing protein n=1 Tax=Aspergillus karnatakaensis TaxID=1810916 RepID=UPI003CCDB77D
MESLARKEHPGPIYQCHEGVENLDGYRGGAYHPTHIGDRYHNERYEIIHKLGSGAYSTVWLARDHVSARNVALKILISASSNVEEECSETKILRALASKQDTHPGHKYISTLLDKFTIVGPNGTHHCIVTEAAGGSVAQSKEASLRWGFPVKIARAIAAQALLGLEYIHACGVVHADLHSNNILFKASNLETLGVDEVYKHIGEPQRLPVTRLDKAPNGPEVPCYCAPPALMFTPAEDIQDAQIIISDFGESFFQNDTSRTELHTPVLMLPPEHI